MTRNTETYERVANVLIAAGILVFAYSFIHGLTMLQKATFLALLIAVPGAVKAYCALKLAQYRDYGMLAFLTGCSFMVALNWLILYIF